MRWDVIIKYKITSYSSASARDKEQGEKMGAGFKASDLWPVTEISSALSWYV